MAPGAGRFSVFTRERILRFLMIYLDGFPAFSYMTISTEFSCFLPTFFMRVLMTAITESIFFKPVFFLFVTLVAFYFLVPSCKRVFGIPVMIEFFQILPYFKVVAFKTIGRKLLFMIIIMAMETLPGETGISVFLMAFAAFEFSMPSLKVVSRFFMIKLLFIKTDHPEVAALVVPVAFNTGNRITGVDGFFLFYATGEFIMTAKTIFIRYSAAQFMALDTGLDAVILFMSLCQWPRTDKRSKPSV